MNASDDDRRSIRVRVLEAILTPERAHWLGPEEADLIAEDVADALLPSLTPKLDRLMTVESAPWLRDPHAP